MSIRIGAWASGLYFARIDAAGDRVGFAPFVCGPTRLGEHDVAVVLPTLTWQAYNFRDDDADGDADSWYAQGTSARLAAPSRTGAFRLTTSTTTSPSCAGSSRRTATPTISRRRTLRRRPARRSRGPIDNRVPGASRIRDRARVRRRRNVPRSGRQPHVPLGEQLLLQGRDATGGPMQRVSKWRDLGRPEAALIGVQYIGNDDGELAARGSCGPPLPATGSSPAPALAPEIAFSNAGIEIDRTASSSPRGTRCSRRSQPSRVGE